VLCVTCVSRMCVMSVSCVCHECVTCVSCVCVMYDKCVGLARTIHIRCIYGVFGRKITKYTVIYGAYIRFWPTLGMCVNGAKVGNHMCGKWKAGPPML